MARTNVSQPVICLGEEVFFLNVLAASEHTMPYDCMHDYFKETVSCLYCVPLVATLRPPCRVVVAVSFSSRASEDALFLPQRKMCASDVR